MESFQQTFILENLNAISDSEKLEKKRNYNSKEIYNTTENNIFLSRLKLDPELFINLAHDGLCKS